jgi:hypothetical protein
MKLVKSFVVVAGLAGLPGCFLLAAAAQRAQPSAQVSTVPGTGSPVSEGSPPAAAEHSEPIADATALPPEVDVAPPRPGMPDLRLSIGRRSDGGSAPVVFETLARTMTPDDVDALFPGAKKVSLHGLSKVKAKRLPGVDEIEFSFQDGKLYSATLSYQPALSTASFGEYFRRVVANKYGDSKDDIMTYALSNGVLVQATKFVDHYQLSYSPPR